MVDNEYNYDYNTTNYKFDNDDDNDDTSLKLEMRIMKMMSNCFLKNNDKNNYDYYMLLCHNDIFVKSRSYFCLFKLEVVFFS